MGVVLQIRDESAVLRIITALVESAEHHDDPNEARARLILSNQVADALERAERRPVIRERLTP